jgi:hypothetical protein
MSDSNPIAQFKAHYGAPDADEDALVSETVSRFILADQATRQQFVQGLRDSMIEDEIGLSDRAERHALHRKFSSLHRDLKRLGR